MVESNVDDTSMQGIEKSNQIYVKQLDRNTTEEDLRSKFGEFGTINSCELKHNKYAFIDYTEADAVDKAIAEMNGAKFINGETIVV